MKILFVGVFDMNKRSTNTSQLLSFKQLGHEVVGYNYRQRALLIGKTKRDLHLYGVIEKENFDLVVFRKCNGISLELFKKTKELTKTCLWFMDPLISYDKEMHLKTQLVSYFCCDKENVLSIAKQINPNSFHVCEGYDEDVDKPHNLKKEYDVSFIGNLYGDRLDMINSIDREVKSISGAYGLSHSIEVSKTRINLNFCTADGASDRVYKIMAAGGFLLTNDWEGRKKYLTDEQECVIFNNVEELNKKIVYYLENDEQRERIAAAGCRKIKDLNRINWAKNIVEFSYEA